MNLLLENPKAVRLLMRRLLTAVDCESKLPKEVKLKVTISGEYSLTQSLLQNCLSQLSYLADDIGSEIGV